MGPEAGSDDQAGSDDYFDRLDDAELLAYDEMYPGMVESQFY